MRVYLDGRWVTLNESDELGQGNEAYVYTLGGGRALKIYKKPDDLSYAGKPNEAHEREMAGKRLRVLQQKLPSFPSGLPADVVTPDGFAYDSPGGNIVGYVMRQVQGYMLKELGHPSFSQQSGLGRNDIVNMFRRLGGTVTNAHEQGFVFADFTPMNSMVEGLVIPVIDADAGQWGSYLTPTFTARYVDPRLCDPKQPKPMMVQPHNVYSDITAWHIMFFESLFWANPYGGSYINKKGETKILDTQRPMLGISVYNDRVRYPRAAVPLDDIPAEAQDYFREGFEGDRGGQMFNELPPERVMTAIATGKSTAPTVPVNQQAVVVRGNLTANLVFSTYGVITTAVVQNGKLLFVYHDAGRYYREDKTLVAQERMSPHTQTWITGSQTLVSNRGRVKIGGTTFLTDSIEPQSILATNGMTYFLAQDGQIMKMSQYGLEPIAGIIPNQTQFWVGEDFGFGYYRVGALTKAFVFNIEYRAVNDSINLSIEGQLLSSHAILSKDLVWFFYSNMVNGEIHNHCVVIDRNGNIVAEAQTIDGEDNWLGVIRKGHPVADFILLPTDEGIVKVQIQNGNLVKTQEYPDTRDFVTDASKLLPAHGGLYAVSANTIHHLKLG